MKKDTPPDSGVFGFITVIGWIGLVASVLLAAAMFNDGWESQGITFGLSGSLGGLFLIGIGQMGEAMRRTAWATVRLVEMQRAQMPALEEVAQASGAPPSRSLAQVYRERSIDKTPFGYEVDGKRFDTIAEARRYIDRPTS